jgi:large subunit ribosomal protein L18
MINTNKRKTALFNRRRGRVKSKMNRYDGKLRLVVTRSHQNLTGQIVDDIQGKTIVSVSSLEKVLKKTIKTNQSKIEIAKELGKIIGARAADAKIDSVVFDRNGRLYHGRVKAFAEGARESGLKF